MYSRKGLKQLKKCKNPFEKERLYILKDLHGSFRPGQVTAIMGPSGIYHMLDLISYLTILILLFRRGQDHTIELDSRKITKRKHGRRDFSKRIANEKDPHKQVA